MRRGVYNRFNRGELDSKALLRDDVERVNNSCSLMQNMMPQRLGPMQYRPGTIHLATIGFGTYHVPFVARTDDTAILALRQGQVRVWVDDELVIKTMGNLTLINEEFTSDLSGWTDASGIGSVTSWNSSGAAQLVGARNTSAKLYQTFANVGAGVDQSILINVEQSPIEVRVGESGVDSFDLFKGILEPGLHQLVFTPAATATLTMINTNEYQALVRYVRVGDGTVLELPTPAVITELSSIRSAQSADVMFFATSSTPQFKVERRGRKSWSIVDFRMDDGPFGLINNTDTTLAVASLSGNSNIISSDDYFEVADVGRVVKIISDEQRVVVTITAEDNGTDSIRVVGVDSPVRRFLIQLSGTWVGTVTLQRSVDDRTWQDVETYGSNRNKFYNDKLDNAILHYRLWVNIGDFTSGAITMSLNYDSGSIDGIARITSFTSATQVGIQVLTHFGSTNPTKDWHISEWGGKGKFPSAVGLYEGRLWWAGLSKLWGSVSDEYASFDDELEGDSAPIRRTIGFGPVDRIDWINASSGLLLGLASDEITVRSSSDGVALTQQNCNLKPGSTQGVAPVEPIKVDNSLVFVQRSGIKMIDVSYGTDRISSIATDMMTLNPDIASPGIVRMAVSRQPETRTYVVLEDGTMRVHLQDLAEDVVAWSQIVMNGDIKDVVVLPGTVEDVVYISILRDGVLQFEKFSRLRDMVDQHFDGAVVYESPGTSVLTGLDHIEGDTVRAWADKQDRGEYIVSGGTIDVGTVYNNVTVGLGYWGWYKSNKVSQYIPRARVIGLLKRVVDLSLIMEDFWPGAVLVGPSFTLLEGMPDIEFGKLLDMTTMLDEYDEHPFEFNGNDDIDPRIHMLITGPAVILGISYGVLTEDEVKE